MEFIEVLRITNNRKGEQISVPETICVSDIITFRPWHKGSSDTLDGDMTLLVLDQNSKLNGNVQDEDPKKDPENENQKKAKKKTTNELHIHESYSKFLSRMSGRVILLQK